MSAIVKNIMFPNNYLINEKLSLANNSIALQFIENKNITAELILANKKLALQNEDKDTRAAELILIFRELAFQNIEKEKRAKELVITNNKLASKNIQREIQTAELNLANKELLAQNQEKEKRANELILINNELKKAEEYHTEYIKGLEEMMFITSHKIRIPVANILGLTKLLEDTSNSPDEIAQTLNYIKESALSLDDFTTELTHFISNLKHKSKI
ncbi:diguanylate cyclase [Flavobacterium sp. RSB2_4_14]|uniref:diguanylate cyclase n=1 Tax=Flavobacterium sp. RSB2_4_14 TaxID=3447665 RepID=UPI003F2D5665